MGSHEGGQKIVRIATRTIVRNPTPPSFSINQLFFDQHHAGKQPLRRKGAASGGVGTTRVVNAEHGTIGFRIVIPMEDEE